MKKYICAGLQAGAFIYGAFSTLGKSYLNTMNKFKFLGAIAGISVFLTIFGAWSKLLHQAHADTVLTIGMWSLAVSAAILVYLNVSETKK